MNPKNATLSLNLTLLDNSRAATTLAASIRDAFQDTIHTFSFGQKGILGMEADIAVKIPSNISGDALVLYSYDSSTQDYTKISKASTWIDANGYIHFKITVGHSIILSKGELKQK